jgi:hypothetical protein
VEKKEKNGNSRSRTPKETQTAQETIPQKASETEISLGFKTNLK